MASSTVPTLKLEVDGGNWKAYRANLLEVAATKGWLGILSGWELTTRFQDPTPISIPDEKPIEASSDNEMQESCMKPNKLSVKLPNEERLKDELTEASSKDEAEAAVGTAQQVSSQSVEVKEYLPEVPSTRIYISIYTKWSLITISRERVPTIRVVVAKEGGEGGTMTKRTMRKRDGGGSGKRCSVGVSWV
ncbi:hypothetical protein EDD16DRAFT_1723141 [Pisolithus croceorrhizus]|nr:hypothetical protein EDD16DRAFT_1723141 [Pisolithus croceorrhizus]